MDLTNDELIQAVIEAFGRKFAITQIDTSRQGEIRFAIGGHKLRLSTYGSVESVIDSMLSSDMTARLAELVLRPITSRMSNMKLAA
jgi:predicted SpoU family rRNA methylase